MVGYNLTTPQTLPSGVLVKKVGKHSPEFHPRSEKATQNSWLAKSYFLPLEAVKTKPRKNLVHFCNCLVFSHGIVWLGDGCRKLWYSSRDVLGNSNGQKFSRTSDCGKSQGRRWHRGGCQGDAWTHTQGEIINFILLDQCRKIHLIDYGLHPPIVAAILLCCKTKLRESLRNNELFLSKVPLCRMCFSYALVYY